MLQTDIKKYLTYNVLILSWCDLNYISLTIREHELQIIARPIYIKYHDVTAPFIAHCIGKTLSATMESSKREGSIQWHSQTWISVIVFWFYFVLLVGIYSMALAIIGTSTE